MGLQGLRAGGPTRPSGRWANKAFGPVGLQGLRAGGPTRPLGRWAYKAFRPVGQQGLRAGGPTRPLGRWAYKAFRPVGQRGLRAGGPTRPSGRWAYMYMYNTMYNTTVRPAQLELGLMLFLGRGIHVSLITAELRVYHHSSVF